MASSVPSAVPDPFGEFLRREPSEVMRRSRLSGRELAAADLERRAAEAAPAAASSGGSPDALREFAVELASSKPAKAAVLRDALNEQAVGDPGVEGEDEPEFDWLAHLEDEGKPLSELVNDDDEAGAW